MANLDVQIAAGAYLGGSGYGHHSLSGMVLTNTNTLVVPYIRSLGSPASYMHCIGSSIDFGATWTETILEDFGTGSSYFPNEEAGIQCHISEDGKRLFVVASNTNPTNTTLGIKIYCKANNGSWSTVTVLNHTRTLWSGSSCLVKSYYRRGASVNEDEIVIVWCEYPATNGQYPMYMRVWNSTSGLGSEIDVSTAIGNIPASFGYDQGSFSLAPHPTTYEPIVAYNRIINTRGALSGYLRNGDGSWTALGDVTDINYGVFNPILYVRRAADGGYVLDMYHQYMSYTGAARRVRHALSGGSWSAPETGKTFSYPYYGMAFSMKDGGVPGNEEYDRYMIYSRGVNVYCQLPPHTTPSTDYELVPLETSARSKRAILTMYYPGPDADTRYPYQRFNDKYAFAYERDITGSPYKEVRFFSRDGISWNTWDIPYPIFKISQPTGNILLGMTPIIGGTDLTENGSDVVLPTVGSTQEYVYQKIGFRNDLPSPYNMDVTITSDKGTPLVALGSAIDDMEDAIGYTYSSNTISFTSIAASSTVYLWFRWQAPTGFKITPVGSVRHIFRRVIS